MSSDFTQASFGIEWKLGSTLWRVSVSADASEGSVRGVLGVPPIGGTIYWRIWCDENRSWYRQLPWWRYGCFNLLDFLLGESVCRDVVVKDPMFDDKAMSRWIILNVRSVPEAIGKVITTVLEGRGRYSAFHFESEGIIYHTKH